MTSHPEWSTHTTSMEVGRAFSEAIKGKNVVVTGVSLEGIGGATALAIAAQGPGRLVLASRTPSKLDAVVADIAQKYPSTNVSAVPLDLGSLDSVRDAAAQINGLVDGRLHVLINNAGINGLKREVMTAPDGTRLDKQLFVNHLGPFLLTSLLLPALKKAAAEGVPRGSVRVVNVSSLGHRLSPVRYSDLAFEKPDESIPEAERPPAMESPLQRMTDPESKYPGFRAYGQSKCANVLYAAELTRRLFGSAGILALSLHPGAIMTQLVRTLDQEGYDDVLATAPKEIWKTLDAGASTTMVAAFDPALAEQDIGGAVLGYLNDCQLADDLAADYVKDKDAAKKLWDMSEKMLNIKA